MLAALTGAVGLEPQACKTALREGLRRRALPERIVEANLALFAEALERTRTAEVPVGGTAHPVRRFPGFAALPAGAQTSLRAAARTRREGQIEFADPEHRCDGCALCVAQCPEGILGLDDAGLVRGARFESFCKVCGECVAACPHGLFRRAGGMP